MLLCQFEPNKISMECKHQSGQMVNVQVTAYFNEVFYE